jgi:hypothetical protein
MIQHPLPVFERLSLLEMNLGLYRVAYRSCLDGSRVIVVDPTTSPQLQREGMARELYVAFCRSPRAAELAWFCRQQPFVHRDLFARCLLAPAPWVENACTENPSVEGLAARFGVTTRTMTQRLNEVSRHPSIRTIPKKHLGHGAQQDLEVEPDRPVFDVVDIKQYHLIEAEQAAPANLP